MAGYFILSTRKGDYRALAFQGSQVYASHAQVTALLRAHLGESHARLLAEPIMDPQGNTVDWYAARPVRPLADLSPERRASVQARLGALVADIEALAARIRQDKDPAKSLSGTMLQLAVRYPSPECVYAGDDDQPVLVCWGMALPGAAAPEGIRGPGALVAPPPPLADGACGDPGRIVREGEGRPAAPTPPAVIVEGQPWWKKVLMLLLGLLLALILFWSLHAFFPGIPLPLPAGCVKAPLPAPAAVPTAIPDPAPTDADLASLRAEIEALRRAARQRAEECAPPPPPAESPKIPEETEPPKDLGDLLGDLTTLPKEEPKAAPKPKKEPPKPEAKQETPKKGDPLKLPDKDDKSMDFLDGCWNCRTGLTDTRGNPIRVRFCFGKSGKGQITILDRRGTTFTGTANAHMRDGRLHIDTGDATSRTSRNGFNGVRIDCTPGANNAAMCHGRNKTDNSPWKATFLRD